MQLTGQRNERITLESRTQGKDGHGGMTEAWVPIAETWAEVRLYSGEERRATAHGGALPIARTEFRIRWRDTVTPACRVRWRGALYNIRAIAGSRRERNMILVCDTGANDGR
jgi:SPP1 family predicted phage head-tail adaptor